MVKFDDKSDADYKSLKNQIVNIMRPPKLQQSETIGATPEVRQSSFSPLYVNACRTLPWIKVRATKNADEFLICSSLTSSHDVQDHRLGTVVQHIPEGLYDAQEEQLKSPQRQQQKLPQNHFKGHNTSSLSSKKLSNGLTSLNLVPRRFDSTLSPINDIFNRLEMFDTVFIVDDTGSMTLAAREDDLEGLKRWDVAKDAIRHITALAAAKDVDGIDIRFLRSRDLAENHIISITKVMETLDSVIMLDALRGGSTFFEDRLKDEICPRLELFSQYREQDTVYESMILSDRAHLKRPQVPKRLNIIVITDGQANDMQEVEELIVDTAQELDRLKAPAAQIRVQFVQIGEDESTRKSLKRLEDDLKRHDPPIRYVSFPPLSFNDPC